MGPYDIPNAFIEGFDVVVNTQKTAAYRAPGSPAAAFAAESLIDELCEILSMDPIEFRLLNASKEGTRQAAGPAFRRIGNMEMLQAAKDTLTGRRHSKVLIGAGAWPTGAGSTEAVPLAQSPA